MDDYENLGLNNTELEDRYIANIRHAMARLVKYLEDPSVTDIWRNPDGWVWVKAFGRPKEAVFEMPSKEANKIVKFIASTIRKTINVDSPRFSGVIPFYNVRVEVTGFPRVRSMTFVIRKKPSRVFLLDDYKKDGRLSESHHAAIQELIVNHESFLIAGSTGSGKTTLFNAVLAEIGRLTPKDRVYIVEDTGEVQCSIKDSVTMVVQPEEVHEAILQSLRYNPDRVFFGELREKSAVSAWVESLNTGHPGGASTIHANSGEDALYRTRSLLQRNGIENAGSVINQSIRAVVFIKAIEEGGRGPVVTEIIRVHPYMKKGATGQFVCEKVGYSVLDEEGRGAVPNGIPLNQLIGRLHSMVQVHEGQAMISPEDLKKLIE